VEAADSSKRSSLQQGGVDFPERMFYSEGRGGSMTFHQLTILLMISSTNLKA
jgi:hypothetical protein